MKLHGNKKTLLKDIWFPHSQENGFTLIEVIIVLMVLGVVAAMALPFFETTFLNSTTPYFMTQEQFSDDSGDAVEDPGLLESIERIIADYNDAETTVKRNTFKTNLSATYNYDGSLSESNFAIDGITDTGTSITFTKVVVRKNNQRIMAFFPIF